MNGKMADQMLTIFSDRIDFDNLPMDDTATFDLIKKADTDGIYMMESDWDKYDLLQIMPENIDELAAAIAFSFSPSINPFIYTYKKIQRVSSYVYQLYSKLDKVKEILSETHGMILWREQKEEILEYINSLPDDEKEKNRIPIRVLLKEIDKNGHLLPKSRFFRDRASVCYKLAYIKAHMPEDFEYHRRNLNKNMSA